MECDSDIVALAPFRDWTDDHYLVAQSVAIDVDVVTYYLDLLISDRSLRASLGANARGRVRAHFTWDGAIRCLKALWEELIAVAAASTATPHPAPNYIRPSYFSDFSGFATRPLQGSERLSLTERGLRAVAKKERLLLNDDPRQALHPGLLMTVLRYTRLAGTLGMLPSVDDLVARLLRRHGLSRDAARRHILWMLKYNLLKLCPDAADSGSQGPKATG